jgi:hypothetical protein
MRRRSLWLLDTQPRRTDLCFGGESERFFQGEPATSATSFREVSLVELLPRKRDYLAAFDSPVFAVTREFVPETVRTSNELDGYKGVAATNKDGGETN